MKILNNSARINCEVKGCVNRAAYRLIPDKNEEDNVCLCKQCLNDFYRAASAAVKAEEKKRAKNK